MFGSKLFIFFTSIFSKLTIFVANNLIMSDQQIIFSMNRVSKTFPSNNKQVLKDIHLSFFYGAKIGIIGLNGSGKSTLLKIIALNADRMVYISCNPATQARDTETLMQAGYNIKKISLVDQFPHTAHIETVVLFEK